MIASVQETEPRALALESGVVGGRARRCRVNFAKRGPHPSSSARLPADDKVFTSDARTSARKGPLSCIGSSISRDPTRAWGEGPLTVRDYSA